ncbi:DUF3253 domain-containing protein [Paracoccus nototheniae]|uniref:DUF3253 domain-containing protein n=1 Tax=Paracoccus nototheniae TaxID=2489002 RepID=A0ABW4DWX8_9RHOB|nr:DUF3253 domain-containing protein [Paracoccus nototheniae]
MTEADLRKAILAQIGRLRPGTTCCPSQIARDLRGDRGEDWRTLMTPLRQHALALAAEGLVRITQNGKPAGPDPRGPIRLSAPDDGS